MKTLFSNVTAVTMADDCPVMEHAYVCVDEGRINYLSTQKPEGTFDRIVDGTDKVLMPGMVNAHTHIPMTLMRGFAGGHDLQTWLNDYIFPTEDKLDERTVRAGTALALAELIAAGNTAVADMYYFSDAICDEVLKSGLNGNISRSITCFDPKVRPEEFVSCREMRELVEQWNGAGDGQIKIDASIHAEYTSFLNPGIWEYTAAYAAEHGMGMQIHISETKQEHAECIARHGKTPVQLLDGYGVWDVRAIAAHCVWVSDEDIALMVQKGVTAALNPVSNLKLGSGIARVPDMVKAGLNLALGTDGPSSNNNQDLFEELKLTATLHNGVRLDAMAVKPWDALKMATVNGGKALGRKTGKIAPGWDADLILLDFARPGLIPCHDPVENIVYAARGGDVCMNMCRGKIIYENGEFLTLDMEKIRYEVAHYAMPRLFG